MGVDFSTGRGKGVGREGKEDNLGLQSGWMVRRRSKHGGDGQGQ